MRIFPGRTTIAIIIGAFTFAGCGGGPASLPTTNYPPSNSPALASTLPAYRHHHKHVLDASCTRAPVQSLQITPTSLTLASKGSAQFTACTQYESTYTLTASPNGIVSVPASVTPTVGPNGIKSATISVTAGAICGSGSITVQDKKGNKQTVSVNVTCGKPLFVANAASSSVAEYAPPYTGAPILNVSNNVSQPLAVAFDASGNLFVANAGFEGNVTEYAPPYTGAPIATITSSYSSPVSLAFDASGNLFIANSGFPGNVTEYAPPYTGAPKAIISNGVNDPTGLAFSPNGNLFVANFAAFNVAEYAAPYTGAPIATISSNVNFPEGMAVDTNGNLFVDDAAYPGTVSVYAPPYSGAPTTTISSGLGSPRGLLVDAVGNLFVANQTDNYISEFAPPYTGSPTLKISGLNTPTGVAFGP